jgi:hypothetical protein
MKSIDTSFQALSGIGSGLKTPWRASREAVIRVQVWQLDTQRST